MKIELNGETFIDWICGQLEDECYSVIENYKDIIPESAPKIKVELMTTTELLINKIIKTTGSTMEEKINNLKKQDNLSITCMSAYFKGQFENDVFHLDKLSIIINIEQLSTWLLERFCEFDKALDALKMICRHEVGHIIDYCTWEGKSKEEVLGILKRRDDEYNDILNNHDNIDAVTYEDLYNNMERERTADLYGEVDRNKMSVSHIIRDKINNNITSIIEISTSNNKD